MSGRAAQVRPRAPSAAKLELDPASGRLWPASGRRPTPRSRRGRSAPPAVCRSPPRLSSSSSSTVCESRSTSAIAASISASAGPEPTALASSRRRRRPVSGVRSWCEASATKSRCALQQPRDPVGHLVERAGQRALLAAALELGARAQIAVRDAARDLLEPLQRPADLRRDQRARDQPEREHDQRDQRRGRAATRCTAECSAATLWVTRTAPTVRPLWMIGTAVARISWPSVFE